MFNIFARTFHTATRTETHWDAPQQWREPPHDVRTHAEKQRDAAFQRRWMRDTGIM